MNKSHDNMAQNYVERGDMTDDPYADESDYWDDYEYPDDEPDDYYDYEDYDYDDYDDYDYDDEDYDYAV